MLITSKSRYLNDYNFKTQALNSNLTPFLENQNLLAKKVKKRFYIKKFLKMN